MASLFESLTLKLANVVELATQDQSSLTPQARQALVRSTKDFKAALKEVNEYANSLPGGDHSVQEQDDVIEMLEKLKERKRLQLAEFADRVGRISSAQVNMSMEVDSMASTPA
ncbi:hypothetical protein GSI_07031 [Ganoderma sinense ZZ0214-1]|uniref:Mediator of RNA polymerase II transcription subunit 9 n=1 Tax=Ganoderma sinense ZZ0214-1 TaxID=1077348 RepID=A0A2G8SAV5_9APHY|nr:hypothetical protein GSI_07031 [Ganoderma sinense ZZ0214-1]